MNLNALFSEGINSYPEYSEAVGIVKRNSSGNIWLIGGMVFRTLASQLYGLPKPEVDFDFIVENANVQIILPKGWEERKNRFGNPKFVNGEKQIDFVPLNNVYSITSRKLDPSIENFLSGTPLTIQAVVYDIINKRLIGERGIDAIKRKVVEVNDLQFAEYAAQKKEKSLNQYIREKADELGFTSIFP
jgi:hypothetical protein